MIDDRDELGLTDRALWRRLVPFLRADGGLYALALVLAPVSAAMVLLQPWLLKVAIDRYVVPGRLDGIGAAAATYLAVVICGFVAETGHTLALSVAAMRTITRVRRAVYAHTLGFAQRVFDRVPTGRLLTRSTSDVDALGETLTAGAITIVLDALQVLGILGAMLLLDARLTATLLLVAPPLVLVLEVLRRKLRKLFVLVRNSLSDLNAFLSERLEGVVTVQLYRDEARTLRGFRERLDRYRDANVRTNVYDAFLYATVDGVTSVSLALMLWHGSGGILEGTVTAGVLAAFIDYTQKLFRPIQEFSAKISILQRAGTSLSKIFGLLEHDEAIVGGGHTPSPLRGAVVLEHVDFAYRDGNPVLRDVSLALEPGEVVALVGRTGSGKTTIGRLLTRQHDGFTGRITLDGVPLQDVPLAVLRRAIGTVQQDVQLFPGDVRFNLTLGRDVSDERVLEAVRLARAEVVVERLGGLDGAIEEAGRNVSGGEAQLLSFARTLVHDPLVLILDEATASVDSLTEARLQAATADILARKTTLVIAHRLSTIVHADRIVLLDQGRVVETGPHEELLARGGAYAELFRQQLAEATPS